MKNASWAGNCHHLSTKTGLDRFREPREELNKRFNHKMDFEKNTIKAQLTNPEDTMVPLVQIVGDQSENPFITIRDKNDPILSAEEKTMIQNKTYEESFASSVKGEHKTVSPPLIAKDKTPVLVSDLKTVSEVQDKNVSPLLIAKDKTPVLLSDLKTVSEVQDKNVSPVPKSIMKKDTKYDQMEKEKKYELVPPDGGWGWAIMVATALSNSLFYNPLDFYIVIHLTTLDMSATDSSIIINVNSAFGMILAFGIFILPPSFSLALNSYFKRLRGKALGFASTIMGIGPILIPPLIRKRKTFFESARENLKMLSRK
ncbi:unnamed protein product [Timema podura]|uniref:Uncharacterized protein n=1 Tax=Timema podura TaxID=61482 RepID=A0ABN7NLF7_TIMPD|nr:unnamed protein product [Timema podura]